MAALTVYLSSTAATTVSTANKLLASPPASETSKTTKTGKNTGWGILAAQGATSWASGASEPAFGDTHGFLLDDTSLEGKNIAAGTWSVSAKVASSSGTVTGVLHVRVGKRSSGGVFTEIVNMAAASSGYTSTAKTVTASGTGSDTAFAVGDKLYVQVELDITSTSSGSTTATTSLYENGGSTESIVTPGTYASVTGAAALTATASASASGTVTAVGAASLTATATVAAAGQRTALGAASLTATGTLSASGTVTAGGVSGAASLSASASLAASGFVTVHGVASLAATASATVAGARSVYGSAPLAASGSLAVAGFATHTGSVHLATTASSTVTGQATLSGSATLAASATMTVNLAGSDALCWIGSRLMMGVGR